MTNYMIVIMLTNSDIWIEYLHLFEGEEKKAKNLAHILAGNSNVAGVKLVTRKFKLESLDELTIK